MVQQDSPVVLKDEDQFRSRNESYTTDARTLAERIEAGEVALDDSPVTYTEEGVPTINISASPVNLKPDPKANVPTDVQFTPPITGSINPPSIGVQKPNITFKSLKPKVDKVIQGDDKVRTYDEFLKKINAGETVSINTGQGTQVYNGGDLNTRKLLRQKQVAQQIKLNIYAQNRIDEQKESERFPEEPIIAGVTDIGTIDVKMFDPQFRPSMKAYAESRKKLDDILRPIVKTGRPDIDVAVRQYFIDDFETGKFLNNATTRLVQTGQAIPTLPSFAAMMAGSFVEALRYSTVRQTDFMDEWNALAEKRQEETLSILESISDIIPAPTVAMGFNDAIRERAKKDFEEGRFSSDPELNKAIYEDFIYETALVEGRRVERQFIDEETAYQIIEESFNQMNGVEQFGVIAVDNILGGGILGKTKNASAVKELDSAVRTRDNLKLGDNINLLDVKTEAIKANKKVKLDNNLIALGMYNKTLSEEMALAKDRIKNLKAQARASGISQVEKERLLAEAENLNRLRIRNFARSQLTPYVRDVIGGEVTLSVAATLGRQLFPGMFGMSPEMGELAGMAGGLTGELLSISGRSVNRRIVGGGLTLTKTVLGIPAKAMYGTITPEGVRTSLNALLAKLTNADLTIAQYEELYKGRKLTFEERRGVINAFKQYNKMDDGTKEEFLDILERQVNLEDDLLSMFPEGEARNQAANILQRSLAEITGLPRALAVFNLASENTALRGAKKGGLGAMIESAKDLDNRISRAKILVDAFKNHVSEFANPDEQAAITELVETTNLSITRVQGMMEEKLIVLNKNLDNIIQDTAADVTEPLPEDFFQNYLDAREFLETKLSKLETQQITEGVQEFAQAKEEVSVISQGLKERFETIRIKRDKNDLHKRDLATAVEALIFDRYRILSEKMDEAYDTFRDFVKNTERPTIDLSPVVQEMLRLARADEKDIRTFFGAEATFFSGFLGKRARRMFTSMVDRGLEKYNEAQLAEMIPSIVEASGGRLTPEQVDALYKKDRIGFGLLMHQTGAANIFANANIEEAEEFRRAFKDYGLKTANKAVAREYLNFKQLIDDAMDASDPEGFTELKKARDTYTELNDPNRPGSPLYKLLGSKVKDKEVPDSSPYSGMYKNMTPMDVFRGIGDSVNTILRGSPGQRDRAIAQLTEGMAALDSLFGTATKTKEGARVMAIDLRTEEGQLASDLIEEVMEGLIYDSWAGDFLRREPAVGQRVDPTNLGFKTTIINELEKLNDNFQITVVDKNGDLDTVLGFNLTDMISREKDIAKLIVKGAEAHKTGTQVAKRLKTEIEASKKIIATRVKAENDVAKILEDLTKHDAVSFYDGYVRKGKNFDALKEEFFRVVNQDAELRDAAVDLDVLFNNAVYNLIYQGFMDVAGYGPTARKATGRLQDAGLLGESLIVNDFSNILGAVAELENGEVITNMQKFMDVEHIDSLKKIFEYLANQHAVATATQLVTSKGITANEALSRAYNIARDMVSPTYIASEVTIRLLRKLNSDAFALAFMNKDAARIMNKIFQYPRLVTPKEFKRFGTLLQEFLLTEASRQGLESVLSDYLDSYTGEQENENEG